MSDADGMILRHWLAVALGRIEREIHLLGRDVGTVVGMCTEYSEDESDF